MLAPDENVIDRRTFPRCGIPLKVRYGIGEQLTDGDAVDISQGGIGFTGQKTQPVGEQIQINFQFALPVNKFSACMPYPARSGEANGSEVSLHRPG